MDAAQQQAVDQAARNIMLELNLRQQALERAVQTVYEADAYEVTKVAEVYLEFLQTGVAITKPTKTGAATNE
jgi:hypothetical protein